MHEVKAVDGMSYVVVAISYVQTFRSDVFEYLDLLIDG